MAVIFNLVLDIIQSIDHFKLQFAATIEFLVEKAGPKLHTNVSDCFGRVARYNNKYQSHNKKTNILYQCYNGRQVSIE